MTLTLGNTWPMQSSSPAALRQSALVAWAVVALAAQGCANLGYAGKAESVSLERLTTEPGWVAVNGVAPIRQATDFSCGITALDMVAQFHGQQIPESVRGRVDPEARWSAGELRQAARDLGFAAFVVKGGVEDLVHELRAGRPVIVGTAKPTVTGKTVAHYEVVVGVHADGRKVATIDPAVGPRQNTFAGFLEEWLPTGSVLLVVLPDTTAQAGIKHAKPASTKENTHAYLHDSDPFIPDDYHGARVRLRPNGARI